MKKNKIVSKPTNEIKDSSKKVNKTSNNNQNKESKPNILVIILMLAIVLVIILAIYFLTKNNENNLVDNNVSFGVTNSEGTEISGGVSKAPSVDTTVNKNTLVKIVTLKGNTKLEMYGDNNSVLKTIDLNSAGFVENYSSCYIDKENNSMEANLRESVKNIKITGSGNISLTMYLVIGVDGPKAGYELNDINIDGKEITVDTKFNENEKPVFKITDKNGNADILQPTVVI